MATNKYYSISLGSVLDTTGVEKAIKDLENKKHNIKFTTDNGSVKKTKDAVKGLDDAVKGANSSARDGLLTFQAANMVLRETVQILSSMVDQVFEVDKAVTEYKKVTDLAGDSLDAYVAKLAKMGDSVARTGSEMVEAATEFRKNSFSDKDSAMLAQVATTYQNVADDAISAGDSASFLIAMMKAFNVEAKDATTIIDQVNEVSNAFAVSSTDIATALPKVSATLSQAGNTMSESIALLVGATELMPGNASRVARG